MTAVPEWERITRKNAGDEWDQTVPRWGMSRDRFIQWHVDMVRKARAKR